MINIFIKKSNKLKYFDYKTHGMVPLLIRLKSIRYIRTFLLADDQGYIH